MHYSGVELNLLAMTSSAENEMFIDVCLCKIVGCADCGLFYHWRLWGNDCDVMNGALVCWVCASKRSELTRAETNLDDTNFQFCNKNRWGSVGAMSGSNHRERDNSESIWNIADFKWLREQAVIDRWMNNRSMRCKVDEFRVPRLCIMGESPADSRSAVRKAVARTFDVQFLMSVLFLFLLWLIVDESDWARTEKSFWQAPNRIESSDCEYFLHRQCVN